MRSATHCFQELSNRTRCLPAPGGAAPQWEAAIVRLQRLEQRKLQLTMTQYSLRLSVARGAFSWQKSDGQVTEPHQHGPGCGHGHGAPPKPTEEELVGALQETIQGLEETVAEINEQADELYEVVRDERGPDPSTAPDAAPCS